MAGVHPSTFQSSVYSTKLAIKIVRSLVFGLEDDFVTADRFCNAVVAQLMLIHNLSNGSFVRTVTPRTVSLTSTLGDNIAP